jgi:hypothetical protein
VASVVGLFHRVGQSFKLAGNRLSVKGPTGPDMGVSAMQSCDRKQGIRRILDRQAAADPSLDLEKWCLVHKFVHAHHFAVPAHLARSEQRREAANKIRDMLGQGARSAWPI